MIATQGNALTPTLTAQFNMSQYIAGRNLDGITHEESLVRAVPDGNHINWILGHVVATRCALLPALRQEAPLAKEAMRVYDRGSSVAADADYLPFEELVRAFHLTQERIVAGVAELSDEDLAAPAPFSPGGGPETLGSLLAKSAMHECYHLGQTAILRRVVGKTGAIR
jgi:uncharacterized damage-inducible protein DinB